MRDDYTPYSGKDRPALDEKTIKEISEQAQNAIFEEIVKRFKELSDILNLDELKMYLKVISKVLLREKGWYPYYMECNLFVEELERKEKEEEKKQQKLDQERADTLLKNKESNIQINSGDLVLNKNLNIKKE